jgi:TnsA endonuclease N terminal
MAYSGIFTPTNPSKYKGDATNIIYRSLWERAVMVKLDESDIVVEWSSEELRIPYMSPIDDKRHMYFPDFLVKLTGNVTILIEVKPKKQLLEPKKRKKMTKAYMVEITEYGRNRAKWEAARAYCDQRGWKFMVMTEDHPWLQVFGQPAKYFHGKTKSK